MNVTMISVSSATTPQAKGTGTGTTDAGLNSQASGFGDMLQVLLMALVPAALVESPAPQSPPGTGQGTGGSLGNPGLPSSVSGAKVGPWAGDVARNVMPGPIWFAAPTSTADTAAGVMAAESNQAPAVPVVDGGGANIDLTAFELLDAARVLGPTELSRDGRAPTSGSHLATGSIEGPLADALVTSVNRADETAGDARSGLVAGPALSPELSAARTAKESKAVGAARQPAAESGRPKPVSAIPTGGDEPLKVLWKSVAGYGLETAGPSGPGTPRPGGPGESAGPAPSKVSSDGGTAPRGDSQSSDGTGLSGDSSHPQYARGQGEAANPVSADGAAKLDPSVLGLTRPDALAGNSVRPSAVQLGQDAAGGMPAQAVFEAIADRAQVARLRGENLARFELATNDGNTIRVRIAVHDNVVSARIDVTSAAMRDVLVQHAPELSQRLQAGGLVPEAIQISLLGGRETGSERHDRRQESGRSGGYHETDVANLTLIETDDVGFEKWA